MGPRKEPSGDRRTREDLPTWVYRACIGALLAVAVFYVRDLPSDLGRLRDDVITVKADVTAIKKDVDRIDKGQQRQEEKAERAERDTQKRFDRIEEKLNQKVDKQ